MKPKKQKRNDYIRFRVTAEEKDKFEKLAASRHTEISQVIRQLLHKEADQVAA